MEDTTLLVVKRRCGDIAGDGFNNDDFDDLQIASDLQDAKLVLYH